MKIRLMLAGRGYDLADRMPDELTLRDGSSVADALKRIAAMLPEGHRLPDACLVALSGQHLGTVGNPRERVLRDGDELLLLVPVSGG
ncbi:MAG: MoaD/ThiS family protein [Pirellulales bacterium]